MKNKFFEVVMHLIMCSMIFFFSFLLIGAFAMALYLSITISLLVLLKLDIRLSGEVKIRHNIGYIILCATTLLFAVLSGVDWIFSNLIPTNWHYTLTVGGGILFVIILFSAATTLSVFNQNAQVST